MQFKNILKYILSLLIVIIQLSCFSELNEPVMPEWDVSLTVPLVKDYTLGEITDKMEDSRISFDAQNDSQIVYKTSLSITPIQINNPDYIAINSPAIRGNISLSDIDFNLREDFVFESRISDFIPNLPLNSYTIIPSITGLASDKTISLSSFNQISADTADFDIVISNQFPIDITINSLTLNNNKNGNSTELVKNSNIQIKKYSSQTISSLIKNKDILNTLKLSVSLSTPGSGTSQVYIDANTSLKISFISKKIKITYAEASFNEQSYSFSVSSSLTNLGNDIKINQAKIKNGQIYLTLKNYSNLGGKIRIVSPQLTYNSSNFNTGDIALSAKGTTSKNYNMTDYVLSPDNKSSISLSNTVSTNSTNGQMVKIYGTDSISYSIDIKNLELASFSGALSGNIHQSFWLPQDDINKYFNGNITLKDASASIIVNNGSGLPFNVSGGIISGYNKTTGKTHTLPVSDAYISQHGSTRINLNNSDFTNFLNQFTSNNSLPENFSYSTNVNMTTSGYTFSNKDTIGGYVDLRVPFYISISKLTYTDSADVNLSDSDRDELNKVNYGKITMRLSNSIPMNGNLKVTFVNQKSGQKLILPKNYSSTQSGYNISAGQINSSGYSSAETISLITEELSKDDIVFLSNSYKCLFEIVLNSASSSTVFLRRGDKVKINMISEFGYRVNGN